MADQEKRERIEAVVRDIFRGQPVAVLEDAHGQRLNLRPEGVWWDEGGRADAPPVQVVENNLMVVLNGLIGRLLELEGLQFCPDSDFRTDIVAGHETVAVCVSDLVAALNNVAVAKQALADGDAEKAIERMGWALSWSLRLLGVAHPATGAVVPGGEVRLLSAKEYSRLPQGSQTPTGRPEE